MLFFRVTRYRPPHFPRGFDAVFSLTLFPLVVFGRERRFLDFLNPEAFSNLPPVKTTVNTLGNFRLVKSTPCGRSCKVLFLAASLRTSPLLGDRSPPRVLAVEGRGPVRFRFFRPLEAPTCPVTPIFLLSDFKSCVGFLFLSLFLSSLSCP